jgi:ABC-type lipoprotein export system ATPase subunit
MANPLVLCENLVKIYKVDDLEVVALQGLDLDIMPGEMVAIMGASGSGKSTLLNVLSGLDIPSAGRCTVAGNDVVQMTQAQRLHYRRRVIGHVWQQSGRNLAPHYTLAENLDIPQLARGIGPRQRRSRTQELLEAVGLAGMEQHYPNQLSGGQQQRAGIAVAIAHRPPLLLADEPTGELDSVTTQQILQLFRSLQQTNELTILVVTHDAAVAASADRVVGLRDGRTSTETRRRLETSTPLNADEILTLSGLSANTHHELIVVDRVGRLQLPRDVMDELLIQGRVELRRAGDHVEIWPFRHEEKELVLTGEED